MSDDLRGLPAVLTVEEVAHALRIGRGAAYEAIRRGDIPALRFGRTIRVSREALAELLGGQGNGGEASRS